MTAERWALPDVEAALARCAARNGQGIRCVIDVLGEEARDHDQAGRFVDAYAAVARTIAERGHDASIAVKPTALGAHVDTVTSERNLCRIARTAAEMGIGFEVDMEGTPLVDHTIESVLVCVDDGLPVTLALQAYLDRTPDDLELALDAGISVRLVKGAYLGDTTEHGEIADRFRRLVDRLLDGDAPFAVGTHDPTLIRWITKRAGAEGAADRLELSFLMGLADGTKERLAADGWRVAEYIPFGRDARAYVLRRERYLRALEHEGLEPTP